MKKKSLWRAKLMARMARDGDVDGLAEIITEMMEEPTVAVAVPVEEPAAPALPAADPLVSAVAAAVEENLDPAPADEAPVIVETPVDQPVIVDCGPRILEALQQIIALLSGPVADCTPAEDEDPDAVVEAVAETAAEQMAETVAAAAAEAMAEAVDPALSGDDDPVEALVAEILESGAEGPADPVLDPDGADGDEILSHILEPDPAIDEEDPEASAQAADALRATLAAFRPQLQRMSPRDRQRFNADVAARMKRLTAASAPKGKPNPYAALRQPAARDADARSLGQRIMASRNANLRK